MTENGPMGRLFVFLKNLVKLFKRFNKLIKK